ncbi:MAG: tetratricopeptide repeat protein, partial [Nitrospiraceae bacterium]
TAEVLGSAVTVTPLQYLVTEWKVLWLYLKLLVVPVGQALEYGYPIAESLLSPVHLVAGVGLALLLGAAVVLRTRLPGLSFGIFWFFITLSVESTLIPLDPVYEHRLYVPMFGFVVALLAVGNQIRPYLPRPALPVLTVMILLLTGGLTWQRNQEWRDPVALWSSNLSVSQGSYRPFIGLADAYFQQGREEEAMQAYRHMLKRYEAEELHSQVNTRYLLNISVAYERMGQFEGAERILKQVLAMNPGYAEGAYNLGVVLYRQGRLQEALVYFDRARRLAPGDPKALNNYGFVALELGQVEIARQVLQPLARLSPRMSSALATEISSYETALEPASP